MMKTLYIVSFLCFLSGICEGQPRKPETFSGGYPVSYGVSSLNSKIFITLVADKYTQSIDPFNHIPNDPLGTVVLLEGARSVYLSTVVKKDSLRYYRYSVIENDTSIITSNALLTKVDFIFPERSDHPGCLLMDFRVPNLFNKKLTIKIYNIEDPGRVTTVVLYNKRLTPAKILDNRLLSTGKFIKSRNFYRLNSAPLKHDTTFRVSSKTKGIWLSIKKTDLDFVYRVNLSYKEKKGERVVFQSNTWSYNSQGGVPSCFIDANYFSRPGEYKLFIFAIVGSKNGKAFGITKPPVISFKISEPETVYSARDILLIVLGGLVLISLITGAIIYFTRMNNRAKLVVMTLQADAAKSELNMVRSRLNPHFVFNALSGIQNLMNKNEVEKANDYLNKFAGLTRHVLNDNALISIRDEVDLLEDYLSMEQLRFLFQYEIQVDDQVPDYLEIPVMLVQPFAENAVKHGVMQLKERGKIIIRFIKQEKSLVVTVTDNGKGFEVSQNHDGLGLKLSKKRIALLNQTYTECPIQLEINSTGSNTIIKITLTQWL